VARTPRRRPRATRSRRARSPGRQDDDPEQPPALAGRYALRCDECGEGFYSARPHARTCSPRCRKRLERTKSNVDADLQRLGDIARGLVTAGELDPEDALALVIWPSPLILGALAQRQVAA
jgi:hypothetical protein